MADQLGAAFLPSYGHAVVKTPAIDRLVGRGMRFGSAYSNSPLCAPARFTMMTGRRNSSIGAYDNASELPASVPTFAHYLRRGGYQTALVGKMHFVGPDQMHGFEERLTTDIYPADFGWTPNWDEADRRVDWWYHNMDSVRFAGIADSSNQLDFDDEVGFHAVRKLRDLARGSDERPWLLTASFTHPHDPYVMRGQYWDRYDHAAIDMPRTGPLPLATLDPHSRRLRNVSDMDSLAAYAITDEQVRNARHAYYSSIAYIDDWVAQLINTLENTGQSDNTIIVFTADHGDMLGERGLWYKMTFFEGASRIPLVVAGPGVAIGEANDHVSLVDVLPTLLDFANVKHTDDLDGASLTGLLHGDRDPDRTVYGEYLAEGAIAPIMMIRHGALKYIHCDADPPQLYNLVDDPQELHNLGAGPVHADVVARFDSAVRARWDTTRIHQEVLRSQRERRLVDQALRQGRRTPWDHQPVGDASQRFMRNHFDLNEVERSRRFPHA